MSQLFLTVLNISLMASYVIAAIMLIYSVVCIILLNRRLTGAVLIKNILNFKKPTLWVIVVSIILVVTFSIGFASNRAVQGDLSDGEDFTIDKTNPKLTLDDIRRLTQKGDSLKYEDFSRFGGLDASSNTNYHIMIYNVEDGYRLIVYSDGKHIDSANLERIWDSGGTGIDIRYNDVDEFIKSHPSSEAIIY